MRLRVRRGAPSKGPSLHRAKRGKPGRYQRRCDLDRSSGLDDALGPTTAGELGALLGVSAFDIEKALLRMEASGAILRGKFRPQGLKPLSLGQLTGTAEAVPFPFDASSVSDTMPQKARTRVSALHEPETEWCERRLLARIHRLTVATLRKQIQPVTAAQFMNWLLRWQHIAPGTQVRGEHGTLEVLRQLQGFEIPANAWERFILGRRISDYDPAHLDQLCLSGVVGWGRLSPHPATLEPASAVSLGKGTASEAAERLGSIATGKCTSSTRADQVIQNALALQRLRDGVGPATTFSAASSAVPSQAATDAALAAEGQQLFTHRRRVIPTRVAPIAFFVREDADWMRPHHPGAEDSSTSFLSPVAQSLLELLKQRGALFFPDMVRATGNLKAEVETGLWELVAAGLVTADGFENLRALVTPKNLSGSTGVVGSRIAKVKRPRHAAGRWSLLYTGLSTEATADRDRSAESCCWMLLRRYGVVFRDLLARESNLPRWRELQIGFRRLEDRGEVRGGRFVDGFQGEQFALPVAVESLRANRRTSALSSQLSVLSSPMATADENAPASGPAHVGIAHVGTAAPGCPVERSSTTTLADKSAASAPGQRIVISAADPLNLVGIIVPGERIPAISGRSVAFRDGVWDPEGETLKAAGD